MNKWIKVSEQMPERYKVVIIAMDDPCGYFVKTGWIKEVTWFDLYGNRANYVTHWRPMPEPPERGDE